MCRNENRQRGHAREAGFTLVELLVVMSIVALLMGVLLPVLGLAREAVRRIHCSSNLKSLTMGWLMYAGDNNDRMCSADTGYGDGGEWPWAVAESNTKGTQRELTDGALWSYVARQANIYKCKSDRTKLVRSYSLSRAMNGKHCDCEYDNRDNLRRWMIYTRIPKPGAKLVFIDAGSREKWIEGSFNPIKDVSEPRSQLRWSIEENRNISARHSGGCNTSFADGHCEHWKYKDRRTIEMANWRMNCNTASGDNTDIEYLVTLLTGGKHYLPDQHFPYGYTGD